MVRISGGGYNVEATGQVTDEVNRLRLGGVIDGGILSLRKQVISYGNPPMISENLPISMWMDRM